MPVTPGQEPPPDASSAASSARQDASACDRISVAGGGLWSAWLFRSAGGRRKSVRGSAHTTAMSRSVSMPRMARPPGHADRASQVGRPIRLRLAVVRARGALSLQARPVRHRRCAPSARAMPHASSPAGRAQRAALRRAARCDLMRRLAAAIGGEWSLSVMPDPADAVSLTGEDARTTASVVRFRCAGADVFQAAPLRAIRRVVAVESASLLWIDDARCTSSGAPGPDVRDGGALSGSALRCSEGARAAVRPRAGRFDPARDIRPLAGAPRRAPRRCARRGAYAAERTGDIHLTPPPCIPPTPTDSASPNAARKAPIPAERRRCARSAAAPRRLQALPMDGDPSPSLP